MSNLLFSANAVLPIVLLTFLGYFLRHKGLISKEFLTCGNKVVFFVCLPCMMYYNIYNIPSFNDLRWDIVIFSVAAVFALIALGMLFATLFVKERPCRGSLVQCFYRSNFGIIGLPLALSLGGAEGTAVAAVISAFVVPVFNILAIIVLSYYSDGGNGKKQDAKGIFLSILKNPQVISVFFAISTLIIRSFIPRDADGELVFSIKGNLSFIYKMIEDVNKATAFFSLIVLGGLLEFDKISGKIRYIVYGSVGRCFIAPALGLGAAYILSKLGLLYLGPAQCAALIALFGSPVAFSSAIMAEEMGCDGDLARQLVLWTSVVSALSLFIIITICKAIGII